ncbi:DNA-binding domain-containing protein [uncultured Parabacteroides sp.]|uniref:DNA-binding domain-containing protein n=1 Tax=uncultured Parabacteroides sp. TaxID=512312 RepID=UPI00262EFE35|nr:DNA-binding domain-containing protein [uncultured Parabacteroides sp.]
MATEKTILSVELYDNVLTEAPGDYTGKVNITGTYRNENIAEDIVKERTEFRPETIINILNLADQKKIDAVLNGKSVIDGVGQYLLNFSGPLEGEKPVFDPEKNKFGTTFTPGNALLKGLKNLTARFHMATVGPVINSIIDSTTGKESQELTAGGPAIINGSTLLLKGDDPSVGVYFTPDGGGEPQKVSVIVTNTKSQIIISVPQLSNGSYYLSVTTQAGSGYKLVKEPRTYRFPILLTVGGGGEEERPGEL